MGAQDLPGLALFLGKCGSLGWGGGDALASPQVGEQGESWSWALPSPMGTRATGMLSPGPCHAGCPRPRPWVPSSLSLPWHPGAGGLGLPLSISRPWAPPLGSPPAAHPAPFPRGRWGAGRVL